MFKVLTRGIVFSIGLAVGLSVAPSADARDSDDCMLQWHRAVASYLTQNRTSFPADEKMQLFEPACKLEQNGDKKAARIEAILIGAQSLNKLDPRGCRRFMEYYAGSDKPGEICDAAAGSEEKLRELIAGSIPSKH